jgi:MFS family permease
MDNLVGMPAQGGLPPVTYGLLASVVAAVLVLMLVPLGLWAFRRGWRHRNAALRQVGKGMVILNISSAIVLLAAQFGVNRAEGLRNLPLTDPSRAQRLHETAVRIGLWTITLGVCCALEIILALRSRIIDQHPIMGRSDNSAHMQPTVLVVFGMAIAMLQAISYDIEGFFGAYYDRPAVGYAWVHGFLLGITLLFFAAAAVQKNQQGPVPRTYF